MYNRFLEYLKQTEPEKVISKYGIRIRKILNPVIRTVAPFTCKYKRVLVRITKLPKGKPIIFAPTHGFKDDVLVTVSSIPANGYILFGSLPQFYNTFDGITAWLNGSLIVDRTDKGSRNAAKGKMKYAIEHGANLIVFPEGVWNKSENLLILQLFGGIYDIAKETGAMVVPVATHLEGKYVYASVGEAMDIATYEKAEGLAVLRDEMATLKWELMERYSNETRQELLKDKTPEEYWHDYIEHLISEVDFYDREVEDNAHFRSKEQKEYEAVCAHLEKVVPRVENAFLWRRK